VRTGATRITRSAVSRSGPIRSGSPVLLGRIRPGRDTLRGQIAAWFDELVSVSSATGKPWYLGEGYAAIVPATSLWDASPQSRKFHSWVVDQALARGCCGLTPSTLAAPEHRDVWVMQGWLHSVNERIRAAASGPSSRSD
jgi:hypothetical protein